MTRRASRTIRPYEGLALSIQQVLSEDGIDVTVEWPANDGEGDEVQVDFDFEPVTHLQLDLDDIERGHRIIDESWDDCPPTLPTGAAPPWAPHEWPTEPVDWNEPTGRFRAP